MSSRRRLFTVRELELLYTIGNQVASAIVNAQLYDQARRDKDELRKSVRRVARALGSSTDPGVAAQVIADLALETVQADRSLIYAVEADGYVVLRGASQFRAAQSAMNRPANKQSPAAWVARHGRSLQISEIASETRFVLPDFATAERVGGYLGVPLKLANEIVGVLEVYTRVSRQYAYGEVRSLLTFAAQASVGLKNAVLVASARRRIEDLDALGEIGRLLGSGMDAGQARTACLELLCRATGSDCGVLELFGRPADRAFYHTVDAAGQDVDDERRKIDSALIGLSEWVNSYHDTAVVSGDPGNEAIVALAIPLRRGRETSPAGAIVVSRVSPAGPYDSYDRRLLETAGSFIAARAI
jgi:GAF domain-containing protein